MRLFCFLLILFFQTARSADITLSLGKPSEAGLDPVILESGLRMYRKAIEKDEVRSAVILIARQGRVVVHEALGWKDKERGIPLKKTAMFRMASNTKPVVATAIAILAEQGKLRFDNPVHRHLKSFDNAKAREITLYHLLTHTSGFRIKPIFFEPLIKKSAKHPNAPSLKLEVDRFGKVGAVEPIGKSYSYSNAGYNTLGAVVETVSGKPLENYLDHLVYEPLGMDDSYHHEVAEKMDGKLDRMSVVYYRREGKWIAGWKPGLSPKYPFVRASGGMISTAMDYAVFCQMYLNGGIYGGKRILKAETVKLITTPHTASLFSPAEQMKQSHYYGYGWRVHKDGVYGHTGSDGTAAWVDPKNQLIVLVFTQSPSGSLLRDRFFKLMQLAVEKL
tara:strand:- start:1474 stop:2643 length:1170 start_codon:yes stop_codon:yes gene_type:complete